MALMRPGPVSPNMRASSAARACPAALKGGSAPVPIALSACRITITVVESARPQSKDAQLKTTAAASAASQIGVRNGRRCRPM